MKEIMTKESFLGKQNMSVDVTILIKQQIIDGVLNPGDRIIETKLAKDLGISHTPVREAIRQLSGEGIITIVPNKGPIICSLEMRDVFEIYSLRATLEGLAIKLAIKNASKEDITKLEQFYNQMKDKLVDDSVPSLLRDSLYIHQSIIYLSNHSRMITAYDLISFQISMVNRILGGKSTKQKEVEQHLEIIEALLIGDPEKAEKVMRMHIYRSYREFADIKNFKDAEYDEGIWY